MEKELELSTNLIGLDGLFCTYHGNGNSEYTLNEDCIQEDFDNGDSDIHPDYYWVHFDNKKYMIDWNKAVQSFVEDVLIEMLGNYFGIEIEYTNDGYWSPSYYNFSHDVSNFTIKSYSFQRIVLYCLHSEDFPSYLKDHFTSYDGFSSNTANNVTEWYEDITNDDATAWGAAFSFLLSEWKKETNAFDYVYECFESMFYSEYVDCTELDRFIEDIKDGSAIVDDRSDWQVAVFDKYITEDGSIKTLALECYGQLLSVEDTIKVIQKELGYDLTGRNVVERMFNTVNDNTMTLEL
jgi:hypothetical protein